MQSVRSGPTYLKQEGFVTRRVAGETIIVPIRSGVGDLDAIFTLNDVGTRIWRLIDETPTARGIIEVIRREYEVAPEEAEGDVMAFLGSLEEAGLVRSSAGMQD